MDSVRKLEILSAERRFGASYRLSEALADRGFYLLGPAPMGDLGVGRDPPGLPLTDAGDPAPAA